MRAAGWNRPAVMAVVVGVVCELADVVGGGSGAAQAEIIPPRGIKDSRVRTVDYDPDQVIRLKGFVGYQIHLEFAPGERFVNLAAGDTAGLEIGAQDEHLLLKPRAPSVATNLTILTSQRVYTIAYSATRTVPDPERDEVIYSLRFRYPAPPVPAAPPVAAARVINERYVSRGARELRPERVWDDGVQTHLEFRRSSEIPAVYVIETDGDEALANMHVDAQGVTVDRVVATLRLRRGTRSATVEALAPTTAAAASPEASPVTPTSVGTAQPGAGS